MEAPQRDYDFTRKAKRRQAGSQSTGVAAAADEERLRGRRVLPTGDGGGPARVPGRSDGRAAVPGVAPRAAHGAIGAPTAERVGRARWHLGTGAPTPPQAHLQHAALQLDLQRAARGANVHAALGNCVAPARRGPGRPRGTTKAARPAARADGKRSFSHECSGLARLLSKRWTCCSACGRGVGSEKEQRAIGE